MLGDPETFSIRFSGSVTISNIADAHGLMLPMLECEKSAVVDVSDVTEADLTFVQLIESARRSATEAGRSIRLLRPAEGAVLQVLQRGGFLDPADQGRADFWLQGTSEQ